jgi:hypothetical protein
LILNIIVSFMFAIFVSHGAVYENSVPINAVMHWKITVIGQKSGISRLQNVVPKMH